MARKNVYRGFILATIIAVASPSVLAQTPEEQAKKNSDLILQHIAENKQDFLQDPSRLYQFVDSTIVPNVDVERVAKLVLGPAYSKATPEQRERFATAFQRLLVRTYGNALLEFSGEQIEFLPGKRAAGETDTVVRSRFLPKNGAPVPVNYRVHLVGDKWLIYDIVVDNISLVTNYRGSFSSEIRKNGLDGLIERLEASG